MRHLFVILALLLTLPTLADAGLHAQCRQLCGSTISDCVVSGGQRPRRCKRQTLRRCRREGLSVCGILPPTTTTSTTTTTVPPPPPRTAEADWTAPNQYPHPTIHLTLVVSSDRIDLTATDVLNSFFFCQSFFQIQQGTRLFAYPPFAWDPPFDGCASLYPGVIVHGVLTTVPDGLDLAGPFIFRSESLFVNVP